MLWLTQIEMVQGGKMSFKFKCNTCLWFTESSWNSGEVFFSDDIPQHDYCSLNQSDVERRIDEALISAITEPD